MRPSVHIISTLVLSGFIYLVFKSAMVFFISLLAGILIDIDHIFDYYLQQGLTLRIKKVYYWCSERKFNFIFLFLHSIELIFIFWVIIFTFKLGIFWLVFAIGLTQHMLLDILGNKDIIYGYAYFLSFRISKGFRKEYLFKKKSSEKIFQYDYTDSKVDYTD